MGRAGHVPGLAKPVCHHGATHRGGGWHDDAQPAENMKTACAGFAAGLALAVAGAAAQTFPAKPLRRIVGYTSGGPTDTTARRVAQKLSEHVGQPVIVENRAGALNESGVPGYDRYGWYGLLAPLGTAREVIARLNAAISEVVNVAEMKAALNVQGLEPQTNTPAQFGAFIQGEIAENAKLIKLIGLKAE